jgi:DNA-binding NarL/FixJ family response regulator
VEDNDIFRRTLRGILTARFPSMNVEEARDGTEALRKVQDSSPDLVFMDIKLPGLNGLEITRRIRESNTRAIIVVLTSYDLPEYRREAARFGANHFLSKGASTAEDIVMLVQSVFSGSPADGSPETV